MSLITTHVLDTRLGLPASGLAVALERQEGNEFRVIGSAETDSDGRVRDLLSTVPLMPGIYRIRFDTGPYFSRLDVKTFYPEVAVVFEVVEGSAHYHVPLLLSPFGYSTYRGT